MKIEFNHEQKIVSVWTTNADNDDMMVGMLCEQYRKSPYKVVVFHSGAGSLIDGSIRLLKHNK